MSFSVLPRWPGIDDRKISDKESVAGASEGKNKNWQRSVLKSLVRWEISLRCTDKCRGVIKRVKSQVTKHQFLIELEQMRHNAYLHSL